MITNKLIKHESGQYDLEVITILNLSSLHLKSMKGSINKCTSLIYLNLSRNEITKMEGLSELKMLEYLDLAMNKIKTIPAGFVGDDNKLVRLNLEGNRIIDTNNLLYLKILKHIRFLRFQRRQGLNSEKKSLSSNLVCHDKDYYSILRMVVPHLEFIDDESIELRQALGSDESSKVSGSAASGLESSSCGETPFESATEAERIFEKEIQSRKLKPMDSLQSLDESRARFSSALMDAREILHNCKSGLEDD